VSAGSTVGVLVKCNDGAGPRCFNSIDVAKSCGYPEETLQLQCLELTP
jgi:hypothetical protein